MFGTEENEYTVEGKHECKKNEGPASIEQIKTVGVRRGQGNRDSQHLQQTFLSETGLEEGKAAEEPEISTSTPLISFQVAGRLRHFHSEWSKITSEKLILDWTQGYEIPFISTPIQRNTPASPKLTDSETEKTGKLILELLKKGPLKNASIKRANLYHKLSWFLNLTARNVLLLI